MLGLLAVLYSATNNNHAQEVKRVVSPPHNGDDPLTTWGPTPEYRLKNLVRSN
jgi:hypothetical protein